MPSVPPAAMIPDANPGDEEAAKRFKQVQAAYDVLRKAEERKNGKAV